MLSFECYKENGVEGVKGTTGWASIGVTRSYSNRQFYALLTCY